MNLFIRNKKGINVIKAIDENQVSQISLTIGNDTISFPIDSLTSSKSILHSIKTDLYKLQTEK